MYKINQNDYNQANFVHNRFNDFREKNKQEIAQEKLTATLKDRDVEIDALKEVCYIWHSCPLIMIN